ncbi:MAG: hypothetical protein MZV63_15045 [Marinilabiliales bacterium]|nr:hypothetical protein [Marinilabiliales bacterium]
MVAVWAITYPEITEMQARAIIEAALNLKKKGIKAIPEIMVPLIGTVKEFEMTGNHHPCHCRKGICRKG